jgi:hypothetical protein
MPDPQPITEKAEHTRFRSTGVEQCPVCGICLDPRSYTGRVVQPIGYTDARVYEYLMETDPSDGPFYCQECWDDHCQEEYERTHHLLHEYTTTDEVYYGE